MAIAVSEAEISAQPGLELVSSPEHRSTEFCDDFEILFRWNTELVASKFGWQPNNEMEGGSAAAYLAHLELPQILQATRFIGALVTSPEHSRWSESLQQNLSMDPDLGSQASDLATSALLGSLSQIYLDNTESRYKQLQAGYKSRTGSTETNRARELRYQLRQIRKSLKENCTGASGDFKKTTIENNLDLHQLHDLLSVAYFRNPSTVKAAESGIAMEISAFKGLNNIVNKNEKYHGVEVRFGTPEEDAHGGDIVITLGGKTVFVDVKRSPPEIYKGLAGEVGQGHAVLTSSNSREREELGCDYQVILWPKEDTTPHTDLLMPKNGFNMRLAKIMESLHARTSESLTN